MRFRVGLLAVLVVLASVGGHAQLGTVLPAPVTQFVDSTGVPLAGGLLYTCSAASSCPGTPLATYSDSALSVQNANPVVLDSTGHATVFLSAATYKFVLANSANVTVWTQDNVAALAPWNLNTVAGRVVYTAPTNLIIASNAITPINNVHTVDTIGGAVNLNTLTITGAVSSGFVVYLTPNNGGGNPVTVKTGAGNLQLAGGDYVMDGPTKWITLVLRGTTWYELARAGTSVPSNTAADNFRLTLTTGVCVPIADVLAATTIYWTPCGGNLIALFDGTATWNVVTSAELSIAVPATTSQMYDVFVYNNGGTPALELLAWTNDTTRATALVQQNGVWVRSGATTRRYVGSCRTTTVSGQTESSVAKRYVWNYYNRVRQPLRRQDPAATWNYTLAAWRQQNANVANQLDVVVGIQEVLLQVTAAVTAFNTGGNVDIGAIGIAEDGVAAPIDNTAWIGLDAIQNIPAARTLTYAQLPAIGRHYYPFLEAGNANGFVTTWYGTNNPSFTTPIPGNSVLSGWIEG